MRNIKSKWEKETSDVIICEGWSKKIVLVEVCMFKFAMLGVDPFLLRDLPWSGTENLFEGVIY
jgi:hypothetical protein